jgi:hypothetical protein
MREGYDNDDIYIMVEDEFHSMAQNFTNHLHHAEYERLKKKAKDMAPPTFQPTAHMRIEARKKLEARALRARQKDALGNLTNGVSLSADEDSEQDDPWLGTSLAGLMTDVNNQKKTALVGLEKVQSSTRASKGFGRGIGNSPPRGRKEKMSVFDIFGAGKGKDKEAITHVEEHETSGHDLDPPSKANAILAQPLGTESFTSGETRANSKPKPSKATSDVNSNAVRIPDTETGSYVRPRPRFREPSVAARKLFDDFDELDAAEETSSLFRKSKRSPSKRDNKSKQITGRKMQLNDIPTFLV